MKQEVFTMILLLLAALLISNLKEPNQDLKTVDRKEETFLIEDHDEPVHLFFKDRAYREEYYGVTSSG